MIVSPRGDGGAAVTASAPSILPRTASDSVPSSTVCDCRRDEPWAAVPLPRKLELRSSDVVEPLSLLPPPDETREAVDARAEGWERCCEVT